MPVLAVATTHRFEVAVFVLGGLLMLGAVASGVARRSFLSMAPVFLLLGFALGHGGFGVLDFRATSGFVGELAVVALIVILFRDGLEVDTELLSTQWHLPLRKLALAMPLTAAIVAFGARVFTDMSWAECFLLGALLSPTDPVLSSAVITNPRVPRIVRQSLNLESGLNDGLALPAVLALSAGLSATTHHFEWWRFVLQDVTVGLVTGIAIGFAASVLLPGRRGIGRGIPAHQQSLYALGVALVSYGVAVLPPRGNGLIAVYVGAITLGTRRPDIGACFSERAEELVEIVKLAIFVVFGSLLTIHGLFGDGWAAVAIVAVTLLVARPCAIFVALAGTKTDLATRAFMSWFGPKGVSTMTFSLLVLSDRVAAGARIFNLAALAVVCSVIAHGLTDTIGSDRFARHAERRAAAAAG
jgi:NhaP-type Na+/H+ or K+/H+ antiporter